VHRHEGFKTHPCFPANLAGNWRIELAKFGISGGPFGSFLWRLSAMVFDVAGQVLERGRGGREWDRP
jgi:hypothetical protein